MSSAIEPVFDRLCYAVHALVRRAWGSDARTVVSLDPQLEAEAVEFLREWLPEPARRTYREMIEANPTGWYRDAHFHGGIAVRNLLEGNGITAKALRIRSLDDVWPSLLAAAVIDEGTNGDAPSPERASDAGQAETRSAGTDV